MTILQRTKAWRINLRTKEFMDAVPDPAEVPNELIELIRSEAIWNQLCDEWDRKYSANPVHGAEPDDEQADHKK